MKLHSVHPGSVGLPQGMPYHRYGQLWRSFFKALDVNYIVSEPTTLETLNTGTSCALDETCLAMKIYLGHVANLIGKCDYILVPRLSNFGRRKELCPHFEGLYDIVVNTFRNSGQRFLIYQVDEMHGLTEQDAFISLGKELGFSSHESKKAYATAKKEEQQIWQQLVQRENQKLKTDDLKVYIAAHSYVLEDPYIGKPIRDFLNSNGVQYISGYVTDRELALRNSTAFSQTCKWEMSRELLGNLALKKKNIDGVILISTFPCGSDAMVNDLLMRQLDGLPVLNLVMDSQTGTAGIETRLESFIDIIRFKRGLM